MKFQLSFLLIGFEIDPLLCQESARDIFVNTFLPLYVLKTHLNFYLLNTTPSVNKN